MRERPIIFTGESVRAILAGRKTQTRRVVKAGAGRQRLWLTPELIQKVPHGEMKRGGWQMHHPHAGHTVSGVAVEHDSPLGLIPSPYGEQGDRLWVRETWAPTDHGVLYRADFTDADESHVCWRWHSPRHLAREHSRLTLEVVAVRVERLQSITEDDAIAEGAREFLGLPSRHPYGEDPRWSMGDPTSTDECLGTARFAFGNAWDKINGKRATWASNPWVWVVEFQRVGAP